MHAFIRQKQASPRPTLAIRDYWPWWRQNLEEGSAGKLVLVDEEEDASGGGTLTIAFDDNIERTRSHIIDLRGAPSGRPVAFEDGVARGHLVRAEPYLALRQPQDYFWSVLQECLARWGSRAGVGGGGREGKGGPAAGA
jgi:hypothetical protein